MDRSRIRKILEEGIEGQSVTVCGWVRTKRESKECAFLSINDGSSQETLQLVVPPEGPASSLLSRCNTGASIRAKGLIKESPGKGQRWEVSVSEMEVLGDTPAHYPLQKKGHSLEFLREISHLRPRTNTFGAIFRIRNVLAMAVHAFFQGRGFTWAHTPIITASDCEGAGQLFSVSCLDYPSLLKSGVKTIDYSQDFFGKRSFLTVSGQLEAEFMAMALGDVYTFGPTFRAENSNTTRHLSEFWMIEPEMAFADLKDDMSLAEDFFHSIIRQTLAQCRPELSFLEQQYKTISINELEELAEKPFMRISYTNAIKELERSQKKFEFPVKWGIDLQSEHERYLTDEVFKGPAIVTDYPKTIKPFYMRLNCDDRTVAAMDVLVPKVGEIIGGSQREERLDVLQSRMKEMNMSDEHAKHLEWYLDLRRFGSAPHAGFGLGFERFVQYVTGMGNIRDVIPCPRAPGLIEL